MHPQFKNFRGPLVQTYSEIEVRNVLDSAIECSLGMLSCVSKMHIEIWDRIEWSQWLMVHGFQSFSLYLFSSHLLGRRRATQFIILCYWFGALADHFVVVKASETEKGDHARYLLVTR